MGDEIITVHLVSKAGGDYCVRCPHCKRIIGIDGDDMSDVRGEDFQHVSCGGWLGVSRDARFVKELPALKDSQP